MFKEFLEFFDEKLTYKECETPYETFLKFMGEQQFGKGVFNSFSNDNIKKWTEIVESSYPEFTGQFRLFGYDWLGRCFGIDLRKDNHEGILMFEIGTNDILEIPSSFCDFLNEEIPLYSDACLASTFYEEWLYKSKKEVEYGRCIGYKIPLFLGGEDIIDNLEDSDMEVYWYIISEVKKGSLSGG